MSCGDVLQYALPTVVGLADVAPDVKKGGYRRALRKAVIISTLILIQNRGTMVLKHLTQKPRPSYPKNLESFPSGHMMIAIQCGRCSDEEIFELAKKFDMIKAAPPEINFF